MHAKFIGRILGIDKRTVKCHSKRYKALGTALGRNVRFSILSDERREDLVRQIGATYHHGIPWTIIEILQLFRERAAEAVDKTGVYDWLHGTLALSRVAEFQWKVADWKLAQRSL
jgi:hypothetical protein